MMQGILVGTAGRSVLKARKRGERSERGSTPVYVFGLAIISQAH